MRLGKTFVTARWMNSRPGARRVLVVCPLSVMEPWRRELAAEGHEAVKLVGTVAQRESALAAGLESDRRWFIINPEGVTAWPDVSSLPWDGVVYDESTYIRNPKAKRTKIALGPLADARYRAVLSGLPNPEGPEDFVCQMLFVRGGEFMGARTFWEWRAKYMQPTGWGEWVLRKGVAAQVRDAVDRDAFFLSRKDAGIDVPKVRETRYVALPRKTMRAIDEAMRDWEIGEKMTSSRLTLLTWACQLAGGTFEGHEHDAKVKEVRSLVTGELRAEPVVVWARYTAEIDALAASLKKAGASVATVKGEHGRDANDETVSRFQRGRVRVLVAQPRCLQMGVDLSVADTAIFYSNYFDFELRAQAEDRIIHPRKKNGQVLVIDVVGENTVDEDVADALSDKRITARAFKGALALRVDERRQRAA